jgi:hypothetical protein
MPIIKGAASDVTLLARANANQTNDPDKKSRTFVAPNKAVIAPIVNGSTMSMLPLTGSLTFAYTGGLQRFTVHPQVTSIIVTLSGAGGGSHAGGSRWPGGNGGLVSGRLAVNPGEALDILVGGGGGPLGVGGYGGGGTGWNTKSLSGGTPITNAPGGGGGRTAIRRNGQDVVTAGGGGGAGRGFDNGYGGAGGGLVGGSGVGGTNKTTFGTGGTQTAGGTPSSPTTGLTGQAGIAGSKYQGGNGESGVFAITSIEPGVPSAGKVTYNGTFPASTITSGVYTVSVSGATNADYNGDKVVDSWSTTKVVVISGATGTTSTATLTGMDDDTGGGGGGWYGGGGGACDASGNYGGGGGGGSSYVALLDASQPIVNAQGSGAPGGAADPLLQKSGGNGTCTIQYTVDPKLRNWKSPPFNGRIYIT